MRFAYIAFCILVLSCGCSQKVDPAQALLDGRQAAFSGKPRIHNPFRDDEPRAFVQWNKGWDSAQRELKRRK